MPTFSRSNDRELMERYNKEIYQLYFHEVKVYKLSYQTETVDRLYHEDVNFDIENTPNYLVAGYINVSDNGMANLKKAGQEIDRTLILHISRKLIEDTLFIAGMDKYKDVPTDGDVVEIQDMLWEVITVDPEGYHTNERRHPFDLNILLEPWVVESIDQPRFRRR